MASNRKKVMLPHTMGQEGVALIRQRDDIETVRKEAVFLKAISSEYSDTMRVHYGLKTFPVDTAGVSPEFGTMRNLIPQPGGRFLNPLDVAQSRRVLFLGVVLDEQSRHGGTERGLPGLQ